MEATLAPFDPWGCASLPQADKDKRTRGAEFLPTECQNRGMDFILLSPFRCVSWPSEGRARGQTAAQRAFGTRAQTAPEVGNDAKAAVGPELAAGVRFCVAHGDAHRVLAVFVRVHDRRRHVEQTALGSVFVRQGSIRYGERRSVAETSTSYQTGVQGGKEIGCGPLLRAGRHHQRAEAIVYCAAGPVAARPRLAAVGVALRPDAVAGLGRIFHAARRRIAVGSVHDSGRKDAADSKALQHVQVLLHAAGALAHEIVAILAAGGRTGVVVISAVTGCGAIRIARGGARAAVPVQLTAAARSTRARRTGTARDARGMSARAREVWVDSRVLDTQHLDARGDQRHRARHDEAGFHHHVPVARTPAPPVSVPTETCTRGS